MTVVVDTNVVVAGLITSDASSPPARILDAMLTGTILFLLSVDLLAEYRSVLLRPRIRRLHGLDENEVDAVLEELAFHGIVLEPAAANVCPSDAGDAHLFALLATDPRAVLVTGDRLTANEAPDGRGISPREAVERALGWLDPSTPT